MKLTQLQDRVERETGFRPGRGLVDGAIRRGSVKSFTNRGGWRFFKEAAVDELVDYVRNESRAFAFGERPETDAEVRRNRSVSAGCQSRNGVTT